MIITIIFGIIIIIETIILLIQRYKIKKYNKIHNNIEKKISEIASSSRTIQSDLYDLRTS